MKIKTWQIIVILACLILGTLLHFTYEWAGENIVVGLFSAVNESTWEHLKITFIPMLIMAIIGYFIIGFKTKNYWLAQGIGIFVAMIFIVISFYTYTGVTGVINTVIDIGLFVIAILLGEYIIYKIMEIPKQYNGEIYGVILLFALFLSFILYTIYTPQIPLFKDPINGTYGIQRKTL